MYIIFKSKIIIIFSRIIFECMTIRVFFVNDDIPLGVCIYINYILILGMVVKLKKMERVSCMVLVVVDDVL